MVSIQKLLCLWCLIQTTGALFVEETGLNDFLIATTGHETTSFVHTTLSSVLTSDCPQDASSLLIEDNGASPPSSCFVSSRSLENGGLKWRRNVCASADPNSSHVVAVLGDRFYTSDHSGVLRAWSVETGALLWDTAPTAPNQLRLWTVSAGGRKVVASSPSNNGILTMRNAVNGRSLKTVDAAETAGLAGSSPRWLHVMPHTDGNGIIGLAGVVSKQDGVSTTSGSTMKLVEMQFTEDGSITTTTTPIATSNEEPVVASSLQVVKMDSEWHALGLGIDGMSLVHFSLHSANVSLKVELSDLHPLWRSLETLSSRADGMLTITGSDDRFTPAKITSAFYRFNGQDKWEQWYGSDEGEETDFDAVGYCAAGGLFVAVNQNAMLVYSVKNGNMGSPSPLTKLSPEGVVPVWDDSISVAEFVTCSTESTSILVSTNAGSTSVYSLTPSGGAVQVDALWSAEDGLTSVSSSLIVDASPIPIIDVLSKEEESEVLSKTKLSTRLESQMEVAQTFFSSLFAPENRDVEFGFIKVAVLLSEKAHKVWGIPTTGEARGVVKWTLGLPSDAEWHKLVYGTASTSLVNGINGATPGSEVLVLSGLPDAVAWTCFDGASGDVISSGTNTDVSSPVRQIVPIFGGEGCRQIAVLVHEDLSVSHVPNNDASKALAKERSQGSKNGLYAHLVDGSKQNTELRSFVLVPDAVGLQARPVGQTSFPGERIVGVAYPQRDEVVQSPSSVLGDDSLLLKYLNPHLVVIITMTEVSGGESPDELAAALALKKGPTKGKRKPAGASQPGVVTNRAAQTMPASEPNLFVNIMDTISGRVLHRTSHAGAKLSDSIPCVVTENWVVYAFFNTNSRRTELGVLSLYEGMIDKAGLTAFTSPEQTHAFSSLDPRDSKPVVLSKTYTIVKPVTALGVTSTKGGITSKHILVASGDDKITSIARELLEPRRPTGELKDHEKQEGLFQYTPLVPLITLTTLSYNQTIHGVSNIISSATSLESQSALLAYGGPDIFFARVSPSKSFDLLPESFNRSLLSLVVVGLVVVLGVSKYQSERKSVQMGWI